MNKPLVTVGVTAFNAENTIEKCLTSILNQKWRPLEILVVDDCSVDQTVAILNQFAKSRANARIVTNKRNLGVAVCRNLIIREAYGEFVVFFDDDDESSRERICQQYKRIVDYEKMFAKGAHVICHTARSVIYPDGKRRIERTMGEREERPAPRGPAVARRVLVGEWLKDGYGACPTCSQMARLSTYKSLGGFDPVLRRSEDTDLMIRLALVGGHFVGIRHPLVTQKMTGRTGKNLAEEYRNMLLLLHKHRAILGNDEYYSFCLRWAQLKNAWMVKKRTSFFKQASLLAFTYPTWTFRRFFLALPNVGINMAFRRFHGRSTT